MWPLQDAIIFARELQTAVQSSNGGATSRSLVAAPTKAIADALRRYEKERSARVLPITIRSHVMGSLLQIPLPLVCTLEPGNSSSSILQAAMEDLWFATLDIVPHVILA